MTKKGLYHDNEISYDNIDKDDITRLLIIVSYKSHCGERNFNNYEKTVIIIPLSTLSDTISSCSAIVLFKINQ